MFGRSLSNRHQNLRALKNTLRAAWKMASDLRIVEVGNSILQFKFGSKCQLEWVEKSGPWNCPALAVGGGTEGRKETVSLMDADRMKCVKSNPREHGEKVRTEDDVSDALRCGEEQKSRELSSANPTCLVSQQMVDA